MTKTATESSDRGVNLCRHLPNYSRTARLNIQKYAPLSGSSVGDSVYALRLNWCIETTTVGRSSSVTKLLTSLTSLCFIGIVVVVVVVVVVVCYKCGKLVIQTQATK